MSANIKRRASKRNASESNANRCNIPGETDAERGLKLDEV